MRPLIIALCFLCLSAPMTAEEDRAPLEAEFLSGLAETRALMDKGEWDQARDFLDALLETHQGKTYVKVKRTEIEECLRTCLFWKAFQAPEPATVVTGALAFYKARSGDIKISYDPDHMGDFRQEKMDEDDAEEEPLYVHPACFTGPYTVEISGDAYPQRDASSKEWAPTVFVGWEDYCGYEVCFGFPKETTGKTTRYVSAIVRRREHGQAGIALDNAVNTARTGKPFSLKVKVGRDKIEAYTNNRKILTCEKPRDCFGSFGFMYIPFSEVSIQGEIQPAWIQGLVDASVHRAREAFDKEFDLSSHLPTWLCGDGAETSDDDGFDFIDFLDSIQVALMTKPGQEEHLEEAIRLYNDGKVEEAKDYVLRIPDEEITEGMRALLLGRFLADLGEAEEAFEQIDKVCGLYPGFYLAKVERCYGLFQLRRFDAALTEARSLARECTSDPKLFSRIADLILLCGKPEEAKTLIDEAVRDGMDLKPLAKTNRILVKALSGPAWGQVFEVESPHYLIKSDIDRTVCLKAKSILEDAYALYSKILVKVDDIDKKKFPVYLFSGKAGYLAYCEDLEMGSMEHSYGAYSPWLKQLLIWNQPDREGMYETVRHEGLHQYLDRVIVRAPKWLHEGLARYFEFVDRKGSYKNLGEVNPLYKAELSDYRCSLIPLELFLSLNDATFMANAGRCYMESWAFIHFLLHTTEENRALFDRIFEVYREELSLKAAMEKAFAGRDLSEMHYEMRDHLKSLE